MKTIIATAVAALLAAAPAFAAEEYQSGPALRLTGRVPTLDTGNEQTPRFDGLAVSNGSRLPMINANEAESAPESVNSFPVAIDTNHGNIGLLAKR